MIPQKILIITFSRGLNPGTFMQAFGVRQGLLKVYPDAKLDYLNFPDFKRTVLGVKGEKDSLWDLLKHKTSALYRKIKYRRLETKYLPKSERVDLFDYDDEYARRLLNSYDLIVVGSDTILEAVTNGDSDKIGLNWIRPELCEKPRVLFAASASPANFPLNDALKQKLKECIDGFSFIGVRDGLTEKLFVESLGVPSELVFRQPDPTYFLEKKVAELSLFYQRKLKNKKVALYNFNARFPYKVQLAELLKQKGYFVVTTGYCPNVNLCINTIDAMEWSAVFQYCDIVVTERFHDSVFALRNEIPVLAVDWAKHRFAKDGDSKTYRILEDYDLLGNHFHLNDESDLVRIADRASHLREEFDVERVRAKNADFISKSDAYLNMMKKILDMKK